MVSFVSQCLETHLFPTVSVWAVFFIQYAVVVAILNIICAHWVLAFARNVGAQPLLALFSLQFTPIYKDLGHLWIQTQYTPVIFCSLHIISFKQTSFKSKRNWHGLVLICNFHLSPLIQCEWVIPEGGSSDSGPVYNCKLYISVLTATSVFHLQGHNPIVLFIYSET